MGYLYHTAEELPEPLVAVSKHQPKQRVEEGTCPSKAWLKVDGICDTTANRTIRKGTLILPALYCQHGRLLNKPMPILELHEGELIVLDWHDAAEQYPTAKDALSK